MNILSKLCYLYREETSIVKNGVLTPEKPCYIPLYTKNIGYSARIIVNAYIAYSGNEIIIYD